MGGGGQRTGEPEEWAVEASSDRAEATRALAGALVAVCRPGDVVLLVGGLGAGKTTFAQGFARGLGIAGPVTSPTFTLVREHLANGQVAGIRRLLHADLYRLGSLAEVVDLGLLEQVDEGAVALVEWGDVAAPVLGDELLTIELIRPAEAGSTTGEVEVGKVGVGEIEGSGAEGGVDECRTVSVRGRGSGWAARRGAVTRALGAAAASPTAASPAFRRRGAAT